MPRRILPIVTVLIVFAFALNSCASTADSISADWTPEMFFKNAQEAMDDRRYNDALFYYEVFLIRYPENYQKTIAAEYERAFIHYKTGDLKSAEEEYKAIIKKYDESPYAMLYPPRFKQLCEIGLNNIEKSRAVNNRFLWRVREKEWAEENGEDLVDIDEETL